MELSLLAWQGPEAQEGLSVLARTVPGDGASQMISAPLACRSQRAARPFAR